MKGIFEFAAVPLILTLVGFIAYLFGGFTQPAGITNHSVFGLFLSVVLIGAAATYFANYIKEHQWIGYIGLLVILLVAIQLIIGGLIDLEILSINKQFIKYF